MIIDEIVHRDKVVSTSNGWLMLVVNISFILLSIAGVVVGIIQLDSRGAGLTGFLLLFGGILGVAAAILSLVGHFTLQPNEGRISRAVRVPTKEQFWQVVFTGRIRSIRSWTLRFRCERETSRAKSSR